MSIATRDEMLRFVVDLIYKQIIDIKTELDVTEDTEEKKKLRYALRDLAGALTKLLELTPDDVTEDGLLTIISRVEKTLPRKYRLELAGLWERLNVKNKC